MHEVDSRDRELLHAVQTGMPLIATPYAGVGQVIDMSEKEVLRRLERLRRDGSVRTVTAMLDGRALGYSSCLVAAEVGEDKLEVVASRVNLHPGVTQNYQRNHRLNLWFSISLPPDTRLGMEETVRRLTDGARRDLRLPSLRSYRGGAPGNPEQPPPLQRTQRIIEAIRLLQHDLPNVPRPYDALTRESPLEGDELLEMARELHRQGALRKICGVSSSRGRSFTASAMVAWVVEEARQEETARELASREEIGKSWVRQPAADWPYSVYTSIQGRTVDECQRIVSDLGEDLALRDHVLLFPVREFKRGRISYFTDDVTAWESAGAGALDHVG